MPWQYFGNKVADTLAGRGAEMAAVPEASKEAINFLDARAWKVQRRLMGIMQDVLDKKKEMEEPEAPRRERRPKGPTKKQLAAKEVQLARAAGHELRRRTGRW
eukprot:7410503-Lingulodinium_polyedra.AAC.1